MQALPPLPKGEAFLLSCKRSFDSCCIQLFVRGAQIYRLRFVRAKPNIHTIRPIIATVLRKKKSLIKIIAKDRKNDRTTEKNATDTREENECEASPSSCRTGSSPGRTARPLWWSCPTLGTQKTARTAATITGAAPAPTAPPLPLRRSTQLRRKSGSSSRASIPAPKFC